MSNLQHAPNHYNDDSWSKQFISAQRLLMQNGEHPLLKSGIPQTKIAYDPVNGVVHSGMNGVLLDNVAAIKKFKDPRWIRSYDLEDMGYDVKYGEKPVAVAYHNRYNEPAKGLDKHQGENRYYFVYNAEQVRKFPSIAQTRSQDQERAHTVSRLSKIERAKENTPENRSTAEQLRDMVVQSSASEKELAYACAVYRHCQELGLEYKPPVDIRSIVQQSMAAPPANIMKSVYHGNIQAHRITNHDMSNTLGDVRTLTIEQNRVEISKPAFQQSTGFER